MRAQVTRIIGVYDADGSVLGELSYFLRARLGRAHCGLCDITHRRVRERADWRASRRRLPVPFVTFHRDDQPAEIAHGVGSERPVVVAETSQGDLVVLADRRDLDECAGSPDLLIDHITAALAERDLDWPSERPGD